MDTPSGWWGEIESPTSMIEDRGHLLTVASEVEMRLAEAITWYFGFTPEDPRFAEHSALISYHVQFEAKIGLVPALVDACRNDELRDQLRTKPRLGKRLDDLRERRNQLAHGLIGLHLGQQVEQSPPPTVIRSATRKAGWRDTPVTRELLREWTNEAYGALAGVVRIVADLSGYQPDDDTGS